MLGLGQPDVTKPTELNFAMSGDMTFTFPHNKIFTCKDFRIGQGSFGKLTKNHNNWWVGSSDCINTGSGELKCCCGNDACDSHIATSGNWAVAISPGSDYSTFVVQPYAVYDD